jgi:hypothetical protein
MGGRRWRWRLEKMQSWWSIRSNNEQRCDATVDVCPKVASLSSLLTPYAVHLLYTPAVLTLILGLRSMLESSDRTLSAPVMEPSARSPADGADAAEPDSQIDLRNEAEFLHSTHAPAENESRRKQVTQKASQA